MSSRTPRVRTLALALGVAGALGLAACSSSPSHSSGSGTTSTTGASKPTRTTVPGQSPLDAIAPIPAADQSPAGTAGKAPTVTVPSGTPPTSLESADLIVGTGARALPGDHVTVQYVLATYSSGKVIQSSWTSGPFTFVLGAGQVIPGWDKGVVGMRVGGRRELIIPPSLGYGDQSPGPGITADDTLVFVVDLLKVA
jgi:peptidylprolyl isomerase